MKLLSKKRPHNKADADGKQDGEEIKINFDIKILIWTNSHATALTYFNIK